MAASAPAASSLLAPRRLSRCGLLALTVALAGAGGLVAQPADEAPAEVLALGTAQWNSWRAEHPSLAPNLAGADLAGIDLAGADLRGIDLSQAQNLTQAQLDAARGDTATQLPPGVTRPGSWSGASLMDADAPEPIRADEIEVDLEIPDFDMDFDIPSGPPPAAADSGGPGAGGEALEVLRRGAAAWNNWRAEHPDAVLDLSGADLAGVDLGGADLRGVTVDQAQLEAADGDGDTQLPDGLQRPSHWTSAAN